MAIFKSFRAIRPKAEYACRVAALPYDVMNSAEAREAVKNNPYSFLHIDKAEVDLDESIDIYDERVYLKAKENLDSLIKDGICAEDERPCFYIYRQIMNGRSQTGIVGCASIDDYINNIIKKHEFTRADKEADRIRHVDYCDANTGPIFLTYRKNDAISNRMLSRAIDSIRLLSTSLTQPLHKLCPLGNNMLCKFIIDIITIYSRVKPNRINLLRLGAAL